MIRRRHRSTAYGYLTSDILALVAAYFAAWYLRFDVEVVPVTLGWPDFQRYLQLLPVVLVIWPIVFYFHGLYQLSRGRSRIEEALTVLVAVALSTLLLTGALTWYRPETGVHLDGTRVYFQYSRTFLALFTSLSILALISGRTALRAWLRHWRTKGHNLQRILVVGAGALGKEITHKILAHRALGFDVVGFLDDDPGKANLSFHGVKMLGTLKDVQEVLERHKVDQVFIALPLDAHKKMMRVLRLVGSECVEVKLVPDVLQYATLKATFEDLDGTPVINLSQVPLQGWNTLAKRAMDVAISGAVLLCLLPFLPLVALAIWLEDHGPIFYRQERMGLDGRSFMILKLRSMRVNAEATTGPVWATEDDPRRTRLGSFLRRWSIDELPQAWNVLVGDMSIVGPRPERPAFVSEFKHKIPQYMLRHRVKAGITGWAQVNGWRGNTSIKKRIQYDLYYIENWSLLLDLKILWMTVRRGLRLNAY